MLGKILMMGRDGEGRDFNGRKI